MFRKVLVSFLCLMGVMFIITIIASRILGVNRSWNKEIGIDDKNKFTVAYVDFGGKELRRIRITSWRDFDDSDQLQFTDDHGITYLTGDSRVILSSEEW